MSSSKRRVFSREFKLTAVKRMIDDGEPGRALAGELGVSANQLYKWCMHFRRGGAEGLRPACRPRRVPVGFDAATDVETARKRIGDLERKVGQQQLELDFFRRALRQVGEARRPNDGPGVPASTRSSKR
jgi:transposase